MPWIAKLQTCFEGRRRSLLGRVHLLLWCSLLDAEQFIFSGFVIFRKQNSQRRSIFSTTDWRCSTSHLSTLTTYRTSTVTARHSSSSSVQLSHEPLFATLCSRTISATNWWTIWHWVCKFLHITIVNPEERLKKAKYYMFFQKMWWCVPGNGVQMCFYGGASKKEGFGKQKIGNRRLVSIQEVEGHFKIR